jgi:AraC-like DNA-binding protein
MSKRKRTSVEDALDIAIQHLHEDTPVTIGELASEIGFSWVVIDRAIDLTIMIQDYFRAHRIEVFGGKGKKIIIVELRVNLVKLPNEVREWFIEEKFFKGEEKNHYTTEEAREILGTNSRSTNRTKLEDAISCVLEALEDAINCVLEALELEDELSLLELSKRTGLNRRTIERVLDVFTRFQDTFAESFISKRENSIILRKHPDLYALDETRMLYLLKKLYLPHLVEELSEKKERALFQTA